MLPSLWQESVKSVGRDGSVAGRPSWPRNAVPGRRPPTLSSSSSAGLPTYPPSRSTSSRCRPPAPARVLLGRFSDALGVDTTSWPADAAARNVSIDMVQAELVRRLNQTSATSLDHRAQRLLVHDALVPNLRRPNPARRIRLPSSEREWVEPETARRVDGLRHCGALVHGDLDDLASPPDIWQDVPDAVSEADLLEEALHLLVLSHPVTSDPDRLDFV